jgi:uncharacterized protein (DUF2235 family)
MSKNIVICADGTGNSFGRSVSNVARMIWFLALDSHSRQVVVYDQGIGTDIRRWEEIKKFRKAIPDRQALHVLPGPHESWFKPAEWTALVLGLAFGYGLKANVGQMYLELANLYEKDDRVFLFGFSRGAFTVRALAGLIYRCGLPQWGYADFTRFERAWQLFRPMQRPEETKDFWATEGQRKCPIHFLGVWDTVKSYGGLLPAKLPHLRHNPIVAHVRHALALDERRGWFDATTWGRLDLDWKPDAAWSRLSARERHRIEQQDIEEVWFRGCHSDIGGGDREAQSARIALRWMLGEAAQAGLRLNAHGCRLLESSPERERAEVHESHTLAWRLIELLPRLTIDNSPEWPKWQPAIGRAVRCPKRLLRRGRVTVHESVDAGALSAELRSVCQTHRDQEFTTCSRRRGAADV